VPHTSLTAQFLPQSRNYGSSQLEKAAASDVADHSLHLVDHFLGIERLMRR
jgi:hypothetical protein